MALNFSEQAVNNRVAKVGLGAFLASSTNTPVTTAYTRLLGTFTNVESEGFELDVPSGKLKYNPDDGLDRTFTLVMSGQVNCPNVNDVATIGLEVTRDEVAAIVVGTEVATTCRTAGSPYSFSRVYPLSLEVGDLFEIQIKGDASFTVSVDEFSTTLTKFY